MVGHLAHDRLAEREHLVVRRLGQHARAPADPALAMLIAVRDAGQAGLELVRAPADERQVRVAVDEPGGDRAAFEPFGLVPGEPVRPPDERYYAPLLPP